MRYSNSEHDKHPRHSAQPTHTSDRLARQTRGLWCKEGPHTNERKHVEHCGLPVARSYLVLTRPSTSIVHIPLGNCTLCILTGSFGKVPTLIPSTREGSCSASSAAPAADHLPPAAPLCGLPQPPPAPRRSHPHPCGSQQPANSGSREHKLVLASPPVR